MSHVEVAVATYPEGLSLAQEARLLKPALLYADHVTLCSPTAGLLVHVASIGELGEDELLALLRATGPGVAEVSGLPDPTGALDAYVALRDQRRHSKEEIRRIYEFKAMIRQFAESAATVVAEMLREAGADELVPALSSGLVTIDPILRPGDVGDDAYFDAIMGRFRDLMQSGYAYPLLDQGVAQLVQASIADGVWEVRAADARGKQVSAAQLFMEALPTFPDASIAEILDIRDRLRPPLVRFRAAMIEMEKLIESAAYQDGFETEVEQLFVREVAPALQDIEEAVADDKFLRQLAGTAVKDAKTFTRAVLTIGLAHFAQMPSLVSVLTGIGTSATAAAIEAKWRSSEGQKQTARHQLFFLYKLGQALPKTKT